PALLRAGGFDDAARRSERWLDAIPESTLAFTALLRARAGAGTSAEILGALAEFERRRDELWREYERRPPEAVLALVAELREQLATIERRDQSVAAGPLAPSRAPTASPAAVPATATAQLAPAPA